MKSLQQLQRKVTSFFKQVFDYKGIYIHWLSEGQIEDITEVVLSKEFERSRSSNDIEY